MEDNNNNDNEEELSTFFNYDEDPHDSQSTSHLTKIEEIPFHGLGQIGIFDYSDLKILNSSFYGRKNINKGISHLKFLREKDNINSETGYCLSGLSMGSGVLIKTLQKLCNLKEKGPTLSHITKLSQNDDGTHAVPPAEKDDSNIENAKRDEARSTNTLQGTILESQDADSDKENLNTLTKAEAANIIEWINKKCYIVLSVPIFSMRHTQIMVFASRCFSLATLTSCLLFCKYLFYKKYQSFSYKKLFVIWIALILLGHNTVSKGYACFFDTVIIPSCISKNYDPYITTPEESVRKLRCHFTCPIYIHISKRDELLFYREHNIKNFINYLSTGENIDPTKQPKTFLLLSGDDTHDQNNDDHEKVKKALEESFKNKTTIEASGLSLDKNSNFYSLYNDKSQIDSIRYQEPMFPLIDSGIKVFKTVKERLFL